MALNLKKLAPTIVLGVLGIFYTALPHDTHVSSGLGLGLEHNYHLILGVVFLVVAGLWYFKDQIPGMKK